MARSGVAKRSRPTPALFVECRPSTEDEERALREEIDNL
jgi:hypothetical protein